MGFYPKMNAFFILIPYLIITMLGKEMFIDGPGRAGCVQGTPPYTGLYWNDSLLTWYNFWALFPFKPLNLNYRRGLYFSLEIKTKLK